MAHKFTNNATSTVFASMTTIQTTMEVTPGDEGLFPSAGSGDFFYVTVESGSTREIMKVTAKSGSTFTVVRAQEGTTAVSWSAGATISHRLTAGQLQVLFPVDLSDTNQVSNQLPVSKGGTGLGSLTTGSLIFAGSSNSFSQRTPGATNTVLGSDGNDPVYTSNPVITTITASDALKLGSDPATAGVIRMSNNTKIQARNAAGSSNLILLQIDSNDRVFLGGTTENVGLKNNQSFRSESSGATDMLTLFKLDANDLFSILRAMVLNNDVEIQGRDNADTMQIPIAKIDTSDRIILGDGTNRNVGIGTSSPVSRTEFGGSVGYKVRRADTNTTLGDDYLLEVDNTTQGDISVNLPDASNSQGRTYIVQKLVASDNVTLLPAGSDTIEGSASNTLTAAKERRILIAGTSNTWVLVIS